MTRTPRPEPSEPKVCTRVPKWVRHHAEHTTGSRFVAFALWGFSNCSGGQVWPSWEALKAEAQLSRSTIHRGLRVLEAMGAIAKTGETRGKGVVVWQLADEAPLRETRPTSETPPVRPVPLVTPAPVSPVIPTRPTAETPPVPLATPGRDKGRDKGRDQRRDNSEENSRRGHLALVAQTDACESEREEMTEPDETEPQTSLFSATDAPTDETKSGIHEVRLAALAGDGLRWHAQKRKELGKAIGLDPRVTEPSKDAIAMLSDTIERLAKANGCDLERASRWWQELVMHRPFHETSKDPDKFQWTRWSTVCRWHNVERWNARYDGTQDLKGERAMQANIEAHNKAKVEDEADFRRRQAEARRRDGDPITGERINEMAAGFMARLGAVGESVTLPPELLKGNGPSLPPPDYRRIRAERSARAGHLSRGVRDQLDRGAADDREHAARDDRAAMLDRMAESEATAAKREGRAPRSRDELARLVGS